MTDRIIALREMMRERAHHSQRSDLKIDIFEKIQDMSEYEKATEVLVQMMQQQEPLFVDGDDIGFYRYVKEVPMKGMYNCWGNVTPSYGRILSSGFDAMVTDIKSRMSGATSSQKAFYAAALRSLEAVLEYADRYSKAAKTVNAKLYTALQQVPHRPARSFYEACVFMKIIIFTLRCTSAQHVTLGHFDRYMYSFFEND